MLRAIAGVALHVALPIEIHQPLRRTTDHRSKPPHVVEDSVDAAMVRDPDLDPGLDQRLRDVGLDIGKPDRQVRMGDSLQPPSTDFMNRLSELRKKGKSQTE